MANALALYVDTVIIWLALFSHNTTKIYTDRRKQKTIDTLIPRTNGHSRFTCDLLIYMLIENTLFWLDRLQQAKHTAGYVSRDQMIEMAFVCQF